MKLADVTTAAPNAPLESQAGPGLATEDRAWNRGWLKVAVALVLAGQGMSFSLAANLTPPTGSAFWFLHGCLAASAIGVFVLLGGPLVRESFSALRQRRITVDLLFLITLSGAFGVSVFGTVTQSPPVFYELVAILLAIYTVGKMLGARSRARALHAVESLRAEHETCFLLETDGRSGRRVSVASVRIGDSVRVAAGEVVSVDGVIASGSGLVWTTPLTGELDPALVSPGVEILAGMRSVDGVFVIEVRAGPGKRRLDSLMHEVERARLRPSRLQDVADRVATKFVPLVVAVSAGTFGFWLWRAGSHEAIVNSLAVLVVACPCALGLATPLGVWTGLVKLGRLGFVARTGDFLEALATADVACFDKTGTLCEPELGVISIDVGEGGVFDRGELFGALEAAERGVDHPVAAAVRAACAADSHRGDFAQIEARVVPGRGIRSRVRHVNHGTEYVIVARPEEGGSRSKPGRVIVVEVDDTRAATLVLDERPRQRIADVFGQVATLGLEPHIVTGDPNFSVSAWPSVARRVGLRPEEKAAMVRDFQSKGHRVLFVGDGLNDGPALAEADASIAIERGSDFARSNAMAIVGGDRLTSLPAAIVLARDIHRAIRSNMRFAAFYNIVGMSFAGAGLMHPVVAALLMAGSSVFVSTRVMRAGGDVHSGRPKESGGSTGT